MKVYDTPDLRNIALCGHGDSGKTTLASAMLFVGGAAKRHGNVDEGNTITDFDEEEIERKISLQVATAHLEWQNKKINLLDTPGYAAFVADAQAGLAVADAALILVEGVSGVEVITARTFKYAEEANLPVMFSVSRLDRENASFDRCVEAIQERFGRTALPVQLPIGSESDLSGVVDLVHKKALIGGADGKVQEGDIPGDMSEAVEEARAALMEMVAETDDALMEKFFEEGELAEEDFTSGLAAAVRERKVFPILAGSGLKLIGVHGMLNSVVELVPSPDQRGEVSGTDADGGPVSRPVSSDQPASVFVFKTIADPFAGRLSLFRVMTGTIKSDTTLNNMQRDSSERMGAASLIQGKNLENIDELRAGDIGAVPKLKDTQTCDTLAAAGDPIKYPAINFPEPAISFAVEGKSKGDEEKINSALLRLAEEDPMLKISRDPQTNELLVSGSGQVHVEVNLAKMKRKFGAEAILHPPKVPYLETITRSVENVEGKHKKQSGGRGQFGVCVIHMEPLARGKGFEFVDKIFGGSIPQNYRPAVEKGIAEAAERGVLSGNPLIDFRVTLVDGKYHNVDSSEMAFKIAGSLAFQECMKSVRPTILEPVMNVEITAPEECMGDIMGDLSSRRGKPQGMEAQGGEQIIRAQVPLAEMLDYASTLKSVTSDRGTYHMEFDHYDEAPAMVREKIVAEYKKRKEEEAG
ncbi:elongation factor G [Acidobacteria bacterium Mor1]|nr:elongation factor G [Acidobacteria bacterium Mor1]